MSRRSIQKTIEYGHPRERVWAALTDSRALAAWLMPNDFRAEVGHRFTFRTDPAPGFDGIVRCEVLELEPPERMVWSWRGGPLDSTVSFRLTPTETGTRLHFEQAGFDGVAAQITRLILKGGFTKMYEVALPRVLDRLARGEPVDAPLPRQRSRVGAWLERLAARAGAIVDSKNPRKGPP